MNLKEAFRYQNYLKELMGLANAYVMCRSNSIETTRTHKKSEANPDAVDAVEVEEIETSFSIENVVDFMGWIVEQRGILTKAINKAKAALLPFDIDSATEQNKMRYEMCSSLRKILSYNPKNFTESGRDYRFNAEGTQMPYCYTIEVSELERFDRDSIKKLLRTISDDADATSSIIDTSMTTAMVEYEPVISVRESFDEAIETFIGPLSKAK